MRKDVGMAEKSTKAAPVAGEDVFRVRVAVDLTQEELAHQVGVSRKTAYNWEARGPEALPTLAAAKFATWALGALEAVPVHRRVGIPSDLRERLLAAAGRPSTGLTAREYADLVEERPEVAAHAVPGAPASGEGDLFTVEMHQAMVKSVIRSMANTERMSPADTVQQQMKMVSSGHRALDFVEAAIALGVHSQIAKEIVESVVDALIDTGTYASMVQTLPEPDGPVQSLMQRAARLRSYPGVPSEGSRQRFKMFETYDALRAADGSAESAASAGAKGMTETPDYSGLSQSDHGLAAYEGDKDIAFDADPED